MKKVKLFRSILSVLASMLIISSTVYCISAQTISPLQVANRKIDNALKATEWESVSFSPSNMTPYSETTLTFPLSSFSSYVNFDDCPIKIDENEVTYESSNEEVARIPNPGRIYAAGVGNATITIRYNDYVQYINVIVEDELTPEMINAILENGVMKTRSTTRSQMVNKAVAMYNLRWTPTQNLKKWQKSGYFTAGTEVQGVPYTQNNPQEDDSSFTTALNSASDFYTPVTSGGYSGPKYGNDCSGFVSHCWGINRLTTYSFKANVDNGTFRQFYNVSDIQPGDAILKSGEHIIMISTTDHSNSMVYACEQTPPNVQFASFSYDDINNKLSNGYILISKF